MKIFRTEVPDWGFRADYRYLIVNANGDAPAFFARAKGRSGHRVTFGLHVEALMAGSVSE